MSVFESELPPGVAGEVQRRYFVEARYAYQVWDLSIPLEGEGIEDEDALERLIESFHDAHERIFAVREPGQKIEMSQWKGRVVGEHRQAAARRRRARRARRRRRATARGRAFFPELGEVEIPVHLGEQLAPGHERARPGAGDRAGDHDRRLSRLDAPHVTDARQLQTGARAMTAARTAPRARELDPTLMAVLAHRFEAIVREMTNTLFRTGRSSILNMARDFSCSIITAEDQLFAAAEGLQVHVLGAGLQTSSMRELHPDLREGDAYLHNDPMLGNTHTADHTILVPVFVDGEHIFTASAKAHQADCGNAEPSTYVTYVEDVYAEGGLVFPCVKVQEDYRGHRGHHPHVPSAHPRARGLVRRLPRRRSAPRGSASAA